MRIRSGVVASQAGQASADALAEFAGKLALDLLDPVGIALLAGGLSERVGEPAAGVVAGRDTPEAAQGVELDGELRAGGRANPPGRAERISAVSDRPRLAQHGREPPAITRPPPEPAAMRPRGPVARSVTGAAAWTWSRRRGPDRGVARAPSTRRLVERLVIRGPICRHQRGTGPKRASLVRGEERKADTGRPLYPGRRKATRVPPAVAAPGGWKAPLLVAERPPSEDDVRGGTDRVSQCAPTCTTRVGSIASIVWTRCRLAISAKASFSGSTSTRRRPVS